MALASANDGTVSHAMRPVLQVLEPRAMEPITALPLQLGAEAAVEHHHVGQSGGHLNRGPGGVYRTGARMPGISVDVTPAHPDVTCPPGVIIPGRRPDR